MSVSLWCLSLFDACKGTLTHTYQGVTELCLRVPKKKTPPPPSFTFNTKMSSQVGALIRAQGLSSQSLGRKRGKETL